jgi:hypothetical protein
MGRMGRMGRIEKQVEKLLKVVGCAGAPFLCLTDAIKRSTSLGLL